jgi:asparagine synthase (glutamine-hydrolysing)
MAESTTDRINTFSIGFKESRYNEAPYAKAVADYLGSEHHELLCGSDEALAAVQSLGVVYDEPFGDSSQIPTLLVSQLARRHVTVVLSGDGGDELFGGYPRYAWAKRLAVAQSMIPATARGILARAIELPGYRGWQRMLGLLPFIVPKSVPIEAAGLSAITVARLLKMNSSEEIYDFLCSQWPRLVDSKEMQWHPLKERLAAVFGRPGVSLTGRMTDWDRETYLPDDILTKVDRSSMWYGLEARVPLLDRSVVEFAYSLPDHIRFADHPTKKLLRGVLATKVPNTLIEREKQGFGAPVERWVRGALREWAEALLPRAEQLFAEFMPEVRIRELWRAYLDGRATWSPAIWSALMLAAWAEQWLDPHIFHGERSELREKYGLDPS